ncbi:MAG: PIN domain-containing protein [bacterium]|nr:PIN domain-containing protein [bacterium]
MGKVNSVHFKKKLHTLRNVGLDSMCFLYLFDDHPHYASLTNTIFTSLETGNISAATSSVTIVEVFVHAEQARDSLVIAEYEEILRTLPHFTIVPLDWHVARLASKLRAKYTHIKTIDAVQIASALLSDCKGFITNDEQLKQVKEIEVVVLKDYVGK